LPAGTATLRFPASLAATLLAAAAFAAAPLAAALTAALLAAALLATARFISLLALLAALLTAG